MVSSCEATLAAKPIEATKLQNLVVYHNYGGVWAADASKCYEKWSNIEESVIYINHWNWSFKSIFIVF